MDSYLPRGFQSSEPKKPTSIPDFDTARFYMGLSEDEMNERHGVVVKTTEEVRRGLQDKTLKCARGGDAALAALNAPQKTSLIARLRGALRL